LERTTLLRQVALPELHLLYRHIAGSHFTVTLADPQAIVLDLLADDSFRATAEASDLQVGTFWSEASRGTNALGTAAVIGAPVLVHAVEHFFRQYAHLTCAAVPIFDPSGQLVGLLDATSDCRSPQLHTMVLVRMAAQRIETALFTRDLPHDALLLRLHPTKEADPLSHAGGMIALDSEGLLRAVNAQARRLFRTLPLQPLRPFEEFFQTSFTALMDELRAHWPAQLVDHRGKSNWVTVEALAPSRKVVAMPSVQEPRNNSAPAAFVHKDAAVARAVAVVERAVRFRAPILIRGETGTGKEVLARHAHQVSGRRGPFVPINCAALPETLAEAELFGYCGGAFTGARSGGAPGLILQADGGTLFLDEIGEMPLALQALLLRLLDHWTVRAIGSTTERKVEIQFIAATNCDLREAVQQGRFRSDLLYRINTVEVLLPPLNERADFRELVFMLLQTLNPSIAITEQALQLLSARLWPGNIRELKNVLTRLILQSQDQIIHPTAITQLFPDPAREHTRPLQQGSWDETKNALVVATYRKTGGNISATARGLGISRNTVYQELRKAGCLPAVQPTSTQ
jgi:transcriptional regulator of acetoin/glycerol metabolism